MKNGTLGLFFLHFFLFEAEEINNKTLLTEQNETIQLVGPSSSFKFSSDFPLFFFSGPKLGVV